MAITPEWAARLKVALVEVKTLTPPTGVDSTDWFVRATLGKLGLDVNGSTSGVPDAKALVGAIVTYARDFLGASLIPPDALTGPQPLNEAMLLKGWDEFRELVANAYEEAPAYDASVSKHWQALNQSNHRLFGQLLSRVEIIFITGESSQDGQTLQVQGKSYQVRYVEGGQPYDTQPQMRNDYLQTKTLQISIDYSDHPVFSVSDNIIFRTVHDFIVHIQGNYPFGAKGEIGSYNLHAKLAPREALPALFTEVVGQACYAVTFGGFPDQKIAVLPGFDYQRLGKVEGYDIENKQLTKDGVPLKAATQSHDQGEDTASVAVTGAATTGEPEKTSLITEREDLPKAAALRELVDAFPQHLITTARELVAKYAQGPRPSAGLELTRDFKKLVSYRGIKIEFGAVGEDTGQGEYRADKRIVVYYDAVESALGALKKALRELVRAQGDPAAAKVASAACDALGALDWNRLRNTLYHELVHHQDDTLGRVGSPQQNMLKQVAGDPGRADRHYLNAPHETNARFLARVAEVMDEAGKPDYVLPATFQEFQADFVGDEQLYYDYLTAANKRSAGKRIYALYQELNKNNTPAISGSTQPVPLNESFSLLTPEYRANLRELLKPRTHWQKVVAQVNEPYRTMVLNGAEQISGAQLVGPAEVTDMSYRGEAGRCERNAYGLVKAMLARGAEHYQLAVASLVMRNSLVEHWLVYDSKKHVFIEVTPVKNVVGYLAMPLPAYTKHVKDAEKYEHLPALSEADSRVWYLNKDEYKQPWAGDTTETGMGGELEPLREMDTGGSGGAEGPVVGMQHPLALLEQAGSPVTFQRTGNDIKFTDAEGGSGWLHNHVYYDLMGDVDLNPKNPPSVDIVSWHSVPDAHRYTAQEPAYKRRGFAAKVIEGIRDQLRFDNFYIHIPSPDARAALVRLVQKGLITADTKYMRGVSTDTYPIHYFINQTPAGVLTETSVGGVVDTQKGFVPGADKPVSREEVYRAMVANNPHEGARSVLNAIPYDFDEYTWYAGTINPNDTGLSHVYAHVKKDVKRYAKTMSQSGLAGVPPVTLTAKGKRYGVVDGAHRIEAARLAGLSELRAYIGIKETPAGVLTEGPVSAYRDNKHFPGADIKYPDMIFGQVSDARQARVAVEFYQKQVAAFNKLFGRRIQLSTALSGAPGPDQNFKVVIRNENGLEPEYFAYPTGEMGQHVVQRYLDKFVPGTSLRHELLHEAILPFITEKFELVNHLDDSAAAGSVEEVQRGRAYNYSLEDVFYERVVEHLERLPDFADTFPISDFGKDWAARLAHEHGDQPLTTEALLATQRSFLAQDGTTNRFLLAALPKLLAKANLAGIGELSELATPLGKGFEMWFNAQKNIFGKELQAKLADFGARFMECYREATTKLSPRS